MSLATRLAATALSLLLPAGAAGGDEVTLESAFDCYEAGDTVSFTLTNDRDSTIYMPHSPVWVVYDLSADTLVFPLNVFWVIVPLGPDSSETYVWDQKDYLSTQVDTGEYVVRVSYSERMEPWELNALADTFAIREDCPSTATWETTWGSLKSLFR